MISVPPLSADQRLQARVAATQARRHRAAAKARLRSGDLRLSELLELGQTDDVLAHLRVVEVLKALPRVGEKRAAETMDRHEIAASRRLRGLGRHQQAGLLAEFR